MSMTSATVLDSLVVSMPEKDCNVQSLAQLATSLSMACSFLIMHARDMRHPNWNSFCETEGRYVFDKSLLLAYIRIMVLILHMKNKVGSQSLGDWLFIARQWEQKQQITNIANIMSSFCFHLFYVFSKPNTFSEQW